MNFFIRTLFVFSLICLQPVSAVQLPDFTVLAEEQSDKVVNITSIVEQLPNQQISPFHDERM